MLHIILFLHLALIKAEIIRISFPEEEPIGTAVWKLGRSGDYSLYDLNEPYFALSFDGKITTKSRIDRESVPFNDPENPYELQIKHRQTLHQVIMKVIDINDNKPLFKIKEETFTLSENVQVGTEKTLPDAIDIDYGINSTQGYRIESGNIDNTFEIESFKAGHIQVYYLRLKRALDREQTASYDLLIVAYDGAYPAKKDTLQIHIIVEDFNDHSPEFNQTRYYASVPEDANTNVKILTVSASDDDSGSNARIFYSMDRDLNGDNKFMVDKISGDITLQGKLDYEKVDEIVLMVLASDDGSPAKDTKVLVTIEVLDVNDNQPEIEIIYKSAMDTEAQVDEDVGVDEQVVAIRVSDADSGDAGRVSCEMSSENGDEFFKLVRNERASDNMWSVTVRKALKREVRDQYSLSITCKDHGAPSQKISQVSFKVKVMDINDHYPVFFPSTYSTEIQENTSPGTDILQVSATDDDDGYFGDITYRIKTVTVQNPEIPVSLDWFDVTPKGVIRNMVKLDREATPEINMVIEAIDGGTPPNGPFISLATVTIKLLDENDNIPLFNQDVFEASVNNDDLVGTEVIQVKARDFDDGAFGAVSYEIDRSLRGNADHYFEIHHTTGQISVAKALPNTDYQVITLDVVATDGGLLEGSCTVRVSVFGENRYPPIMQHRDFKLTVAENVLTPKILTTVSASDLDDQYFGEVHFEIVGSVDNKFEVDRDSGVLRVVKPLDFEETKIYRFEIRAFNNYDGTLDKKEDRASIVIRITDVNDEPPMFGFDRYNLTAFAGDSDGTIVGIIKAVDPDSGNSGKVTYRLIKGNQELFHLVSTSKGAEIRKNGDLAYLVGDHVNMILEAQDDNEEAFNGDQTVLWIAIKAGAGPGVYEEASSDEGWLDRYLIYFIVAIVALSLMVIVVIVMVCNRASRQNRSHYAASKLPPYDGYDYADLDEQYGLEPDTVKAYNIDGGGECDRLSAFEELTTQLQSLHDVMSEKAYVNNYHGGFPEKKSHIDSDGYFSLSDPAFNEAEKCAEIPPRNGDRTLNSLLNSENIYTNMTHPEKCEIKYGIPLSPPTQHFTDERYPSRGGLDAPPHDMRGTTDPKDFVRCLPPIDNNFVPMSPGPSTPPIVSEPSVRDDQTRPPAEHTASLSSLLSTQSRPSEITRLPTSLMGPNQDELFEERDHQLSEPRNRQLSESLSNQLSESLSNQLSDSRDNQLSESLDPFSDHVVETIRDPREKSRTDTISINSDHSADF